MKDLNFFASYSKKKARKINKDYLLYGILSLLLFIIIFYSIFNFFIIKKAEMDLAITEERIKEIESNIKIKEVLDKENEIKELKEQISRFKSLDDYVNNKDRINDEILLFIENSLPVNVFLNTIDFNYDTVKIAGNSKNKDSIAQFQYNLKSYKDFKEVFVPKILYNENYFSFNMDIKFKEEANESEAKTETE